MTATTTLIGNTSADIDLRHTQNGRAVGNVTIVVNDRKFDKQKNEWVEGEPWYARCTIWGEMAEQAAQSIHKGTRVIGHGRISERSFEDKDGNKRRATEVTLDEIGPSLRYAVAQVTRTTGKQAGQGGAGAPNAPAPSWDTAQPATSAQGDVWGAPNTSYGDSNAPF